jgi:hypothetical protein
MVLSFAPSSDWLRASILFAARAGLLLSRRTHLLPPIPALPTSAGFLPTSRILTAAPPHCASLALHLTQRCYNQNRPPQTICGIGEGFFFWLMQIEVDLPPSHTEIRHTLHFGLLAGARVARSVPAQERSTGLTSRSRALLVVGYQS